MLTSQQFMGTKALLVALLLSSSIGCACASPLAPCDAWLQIPMPTATLQDLRDAGVSIEPSRRMRAAAFNWPHDIRIALPPSYGDEERAYPVLWVTDGHAFFESAVKFVTACAGKYVPEMIVVGIGAPAEDLAESGVRREYDFTPAGGPYFTGFGGELFAKQERAHEAKLRAQGKPVAQKTGGAPAFLQFLVHEVRVAIAQDYRTAPLHTLFGDSSGGVFCAFALLTQPKSFDKFICGSPTLYYANHEFFRIEERYARTHSDMPAAVFFGAGEAEVLEDRIAAWGPVSSMARMAEILSQRQYPSLRLHVRIFPGATHNAVVPLNLGWGLRTLWQEQVREEPDAAAAAR